MVQPDAEMAWLHPGVNLPVHAVRLVLSILTSWTGGHLLHGQADLCPVDTNVVCSRDSLVLQNPTKRVRTRIFIRP